MEQKSWKDFFLSQNIDVAHLKIKKKQVEIAHLSSNTLQTFRKDCVNTYVPQLMDFKLLLLRILQWYWQAFWCLFGREHGGHSGTHLSGLWIRCNLRKKKICQLPCCTASCSCVWGPNFSSLECGVLILLSAQSSAFLLS